MAFIATIVLPAEAGFALALGTYFHSGAVAVGLAALFLVPTLVWLLGCCLVDAARAERDLIADARARRTSGA